MTEVRLASFGRALERLQEVLCEPESGVVRDAAIQRFEFCFELAWKSIQHELRGQGNDCNSPKSCLREAFSANWIDQEAPWLDALADRNLTSHTYDEDLARQVYSRLRGHLTVFQALWKNLERNA